MKNIKKNIAIISSSPLMMILAIKLKEDGHKITIFDKSNNIAGAWTWFNNPSERKNYIPKYTNIINPYNQKELKFTKKMNNYLKNKLKVKISETKKKFSINYNYKRKFVYNFKNFFEFTSKNLKITKKFISKIETLNNKKVQLNNKYVFDKLFIPSFSGVKEIKVYKKKAYFPEFKEIISEHVSIVAKSFKLKNFYYSQFFDNKFDRVKIEKIRKFYALTARLDHSIKGISVDKLKKFYLKKFVKKSDLKKVRISKFHNYYRNKVQLNRLCNAIKGSNIKYIDTKQFMCGFYSLRKILKIS